MTTTAEYHDLLDRIAALKERAVDRLAPELIQNPQLADAFIRHMDELMAAILDTERGKPIPPDQGVAQLAGIGPDAAQVLGDTYVPPALEPYDDAVTAERLQAVADLYYIYQHERIGVFRSILKLQELFRAGTVRLSSGQGAYGLYQFDRRQVLRYTQRDRMQAYRRAFGYTRISPPHGAKANRDFHTVFVHFMKQVAQFFRDKRVSEVIRPRAEDPSFGSIAIVRRAGLDLRNNLKSASYGHINVLRVEVLQLLQEAFQVMGTPDIKKLYGADTAWDVVEEVMKRHLGQPQIRASQRNRMAIAGRTILNWLAQAHILNATRAEFETLLLEIADEVEEWLTSAEALGVTSSPAPASRPMTRHTNGRGPATAPKRELEWELGY